MAKAWAKAFYNSHAWRSCRDSYIGQRMKIDGGSCEECHKEQGYIVHHKINLTPNNINNASVALNHDNLMYVCKDCHDRFEEHFVKSNHKPTVLFDESGQPIDIRQL